MSQGTMSPGVAAASPGVTAARRVRHEVRDSLTVMAFSAAASCGVAVLLALVVRFGN